MGEKCETRCAGASPHELTRPLVDQPAICFRFKNGVESRANASSSLDGTGQRERRAHQMPVDKLDPLTLSRTLSAAGTNTY